jgi:hypothetical protein
VWTVDGNQFDGVVRGMVGSTTRRGALISLLGGFLLPLLPEAATHARGRRNERAVHGEKKKRKKCSSGFLKCKIRKCK